MRARSRPAQRVHNKHNDEIVRLMNRFHNLTTGPNSTSRNPFLGKLGALLLSEARCVSGAPSPTAAAPCRRLSSRERAALRSRQKPGCVSSQVLLLTCACGACRSRSEGTFHKNISIPAKRKRGGETVHTNRVTHRAHYGVYTSRCGSHAHVRTLSRAARGRAPGACA